MGTKRERIFDFEVQRPVDYNAKAIQKVIDTHGHVYVDYKYDGIRGVLYFDTAQDKWRIVTRENIEIVSIADRIANLVGTLDTSCIYDLEVTIDDVPFDTASGLLRSFTPLDVNYRLNLYVFDLVHASTRKRHEDACYPSGWNADAETIVRRAHRYVATSLEQVQDVYNNARIRGLEGVVVKNPRQEYTPGKVQGWWKLKPKETQDGVIRGFIYGTEGKANEGLIIGFEVLLEDGSSCNATGIPRKLMQQVTDCPQYYIGRYVEVERMEASGTGASRHPHFKCFRDMPGAEGVKS